MIVWVNRINKLPKKDRLLIKRSKISLVLKRKAKQAALVQICPLKVKIDDKPLQGKLLKKNLFHPKVMVSFICYKNSKDRKNDITQEIQSQIK